MKNQNFTAGLILTILGIVLLLHNFNMLNLEWDNIIKFWPLLLIYAGLATLYGNKKTYLVPIAMVAITIIAIIIFFIFQDYSSTSFPTNLSL